MTSFKGAIVQIKLNIRYKTWLDHQRYGIQSTQYSVQMLSDAPGKEVTNIDCACDKTLGMVTWVYKEGVKVIDE